MLIEALVGDRSLWAFGDPRQQFWRERVLPAGLFAGATRLKLRQQQRNPPALWDFARGYVEDGVPARLADGAVLRLAVVEEGRDPLDRVRHEIEVLRKAGARPEDIAVLSLSGRDKSKLCEATTLGSTRVVRADDPDSGTCVIADTFLRFKGLDRPFVIVTELVRGAWMKYETRMHIALTRATVGAVIVCDRTAVEADPRLQALQTSRLTVPLDLGSESQQAATRITG